jgi:dolichol-phosphate mannosyltransferase
MKSGSSIRLSVVVPCFNEEEVIGTCYVRLTEVLTSVGEPYEIIFVNDGSRDNTARILRDIHARDSHVVVVLLSRNFGQQHALTAGLTLSRGDATFIIDADLQDPPELIPEMIAIWQQGYEVVYGVRESREGESRFKLWTAKLFYASIDRLSDIRIPRAAGDFRLIGRKALNALLSMPERHRLLRGMCSWVGYSQYAFPYRRAPRMAGATKYSLRRMLALAMDGIVSFSTIPLKVVTLLGFSSAALACIGMIYTLAVRLFTHAWVRGWATIWIGILFLGGIQMIGIGVLGEYIGRIYTEITHRPLFLIDELLRQEAEIYESVSNREWSNAEKPTPERARN